MVPPPTLDTRNGKISHRTTLKTELIRPSRDTGPLPN